MKSLQRLARWRLLSGVLLMAVVGLLLVGCGGTGTANQGGPTTITYTYLESPQKDQAAVEAAINKITVPAINVKVKLVPLDWGVFESKVKLNFTAGVQCDAMWTAPWMNNYYQNVANGNFLPLDNLLPSDAPQLYASLPKSIWNAAKVNGKIYGVINQQILVNQHGFVVRKDLADKYHLDLNSIHSYADLEPFLQEIKDHEPGITPVLNDSGHISNLVTLDSIDQIGPGVGVRYNDPGRNVVSIYETPEYKQEVELARSWYQKGYMKDPDQQGFQNWDAGKYAVIVGQTIKPGGDVDFENGHPNYPIYTHAVAPATLSTSSAISTLTAICRSSQHPDATMKFINELNTNPQLLRLISYGLQGKDWTWINQAQNVIKLVPSSGYSTLGAWEFGNQFIAPYTSEAQVGSWDATKKLNLAAKPSPVLGFYLDTSTVKTQAATIANVQKQYLDPLEEGIIDPATGLPQAIQQLKAAGIDQVVSETQSELTAWEKANK